MTIISDYVPPNDDPASGPGAGWRFHAAADPAPTPWLIKGILPETGAGLISGQWGTYKTTAALDIAVSVMTGQPFAGRFAIKRRGGVCYLALEGAGGLASRLTAIARARGCAEALPFLYRRDCPALTAPDALQRLSAMMADAASALRRKFDVSVVLVFVDTVVTAAGYSKSGDDNDAAVAQRLLSVLAGLSQMTGALVVGVDHFGKISETGTRGSSAKEGAADVVLALLADRETGGSVSNTRLAVRKLRDGPCGLELPFVPRTVEIGTDPDGDPVTRVTIDWAPAARSSQTRSDQDGWTKSLRLLRRTLMNVLVEQGSAQRPFRDGPLVRAVDLEIVRAEFYRSYPAEGDDKTKRAARQKAFRRAIAALPAPEAQSIGAGLEPKRQRKPNRLMVEADNGPGQAKKNLPGPRSHNVPGGRDDPRVSPLSCSATGEASMASGFGPLRDDEQRSPIRTGTWSRSRIASPSPVGLATPTLPPSLGASSER